MDKKQKTDILLANLLVRQDNCDSFCKYCYHNRDSKVSDSYIYQGKLKEDIEAILKFSTSYFNSPIIKIAGGEIFLMSNLEEFVNRLLEDYPYVLIQSNGRHFDDKSLKWVIDSKRILVQISLDGHDLEMNKYRFDKEEILKRLLYTIKTLKENDVYLEITSVLNNLNTSRYNEFIDYLHNLPAGNLKNTLKATPILLIDKEGIFKPSSEDIKVIEGLIEQYDKYSDILPPRKYMQNLYSLLNGNKLKYQCFNPIVSVNFTEDGKVKGCTNILPENVLNVGDIFVDDHKEIAERFGKTKFQKLLLKTKQWVPLCKTCFNFCSIYNLYLNDTIGIDELCSNNYMFNLPEVKEMLTKLKGSLKENSIDNID